jgi:hypothetical protein
MSFTFARTTFVFALFLFRRLELPEWMEVFNLCFWLFHVDMMSRF